MWSNQKGTADSVTFTEDILNGKLHFLCSVMNVSLLKYIRTNPLDLKWKKYFYREITHKISSYWINKFKIAEVEKRERTR